MGGSKVPELFDFRMERAEEAGSLVVEPAQKARQPRSPVCSLEANLNCTHIYMYCLPCSVY